jgi:hypothetical protein
MAFGTCRWRTADSDCHIAVSTAAQFLAVHFGKFKITLGTIRTLVSYNEEVLIMNRMAGSGAEHALCVQNLVQLQILSI